MADVKREKELAEKRKNDPIEELSQDHLVRKLFSRFKKQQIGGNPGEHYDDAERGEGSPLDNGHATTHEKHQNLPTITDAIEVKPKPRPKLKWGALTLGGDKPEPKEDPKPKEETSEPGKDKEKPKEKENVSKSIEGLKPSGEKGKHFKKPSSRGATKHETIEECVEPSDIVKGEHSKKESQKEPISSVTSPQFPQPDLQQLISSLMDFKVDVKLELQRLGSKINRIEDKLYDVHARIPSQGSRHIINVTPSEGDRRRAPSPSSRLGDHAEETHRTHAGSSSRSKSASEKTSHGSRGKSKSSRARETSPTESMVRGMLEEEIESLKSATPIEEEEKSDYKTLKHRTHSHEYL